LTPRTRLFRKIIVLVFIGILLAGSGTAIFFMRLRSNELKGRYPKTTCHTATKTYLGNPVATGDALTSKLKTWET